MIPRQSQKNWEKFCKSLAKNPVRWERSQVNHQLSDNSGLSCAHGDGGDIVDQSGETDIEREGWKERVIPEIACANLSDLWVQFPWPSRNLIYSSPIWQLSCVLSPFLSEISVQWGFPSSILGSSFYQYLNNSLNLVPLERWEQYYVLFLICCTSRSPGPEINH